MADTFLSSQPELLQLTPRKKDQSIRRLQLTDAEISGEQQRSDLAKQLDKSKHYRAMSIIDVAGLTMIRTSGGQQTVLPPALWAVVFKEAHDSVWSGHLRLKHTISRIAWLYWWS